MSNSSVKEFINQHNWVWTLIGCVIMWLAIGVFAANLNFESLVANMFSASFLAIAALGQMLVITTGKGAIDLSIPGMITLAAYLNVTFIAGNEASVLPGILLIVAVGILVGFINNVFVAWLHIPPMIATMAMGYILSTISLLFNSSMGLEQLNLSKTLINIARGRIFGVYYVIFIAAALGLLFHFLLKRTTYGRSLAALGQNHDAAYFAGIKVKRVEMISYMLCSVLAGFAGLLISLRVGGAFLGMGDSYMLETVGGVVIGGTLISGGKPSAVGALFGCLFLTLVVTAMQIARFDIGLQNIVKGILIVLIIIVSTKSKKNAETA